MHHSDTRILPGKRIVISGMAGSGKSSLAKALAIKTDLPVFHLDLHLWNPGWVRKPHDEFLERQRVLFAQDRWIVDSNDVDPTLLKEHATTLVVLNMPWWLCSWRALRRGIHRPPRTELPTGCEESFTQRIKDEWAIAWRNWQRQKTIRERELSVATQCQQIMEVHILNSKQEVTDFLDQA